MFIINKIGGNTQPWAASEQSHKYLHRQSMWLSKVTSSTSFSISFTGAKSPVWGEEKNTHLKGTSQREPNSQGCWSSNLGADPALNRVVRTTEQRGSSASNSEQTPAPLSQAIPPIEVTVFSTPWGKILTSEHIKPSPSTKDTG